MKPIKIIHYLISAAHLALQLFYFTRWNNRLGDLTKMASNVNPATISNVNLGITTESFIFLSIVLLTLAIYVTLSAHLSQWAAEPQEENKPETPA